MQKEYRRLIFDADHTVLDYLADERAAFCRTYQALGMEISDDLLQWSRLCSETAWTEAGLYDVRDEKTQRAYHALYRSHLDEAFTRIFAKFPAPQGVSPKTAGEIFLKELETGGHFMDGAEETLAALSKKTGGKYEIYVATNGLSDIQRGRLRGVEKYLHGAYISEEVGAIKPLSAFFDRLLSEIGANAGECLMIGDSLESDVAGAHAAGMDACWVARKDAKNAAIKPKYRITALKELIEIL